MWISSGSFQSLEVICFQGKTVVVNTDQNDLKVYI